MAQDSDSHPRRRADVATPAVHKAVVPAAGLGTRFLPVTKSQPKEMLVLVDRPAIQYVVEEAVAAGIQDVLVVTSRNKSTLEDHFDRSVELEERLEQAGKLDALREVREIAELARVHYVRQGEPRGLGHAVAMASEHVGDQPFVVLLPDDIMEPGSSALRRMIEVHARFGGSVLCLKEVPPSEISMYGAVRAEPVEPGLVRVLGLVEKPAAAEAPSNLAVMGRYLLTPGIFDAMERVGPGRGGELQLTDGIASMLADEQVHGLVIDGGRYDIGNKLDYLKATVSLALGHPELGPGFRKALEELGQEGLSR